MTEMCELNVHKVNTLFFNNTYSLLHVDNNRNHFCYKYYITNTTY